MQKAINFVREKISQHPEMEDGSQGLEKLCIQ